MFKNPFKTRSNATIKVSERKRVRSQLAAAYPLLTEDDLTNLIPNKGDVRVMKITTTAAQSVTVHINNKDPICFEVDGKIYPTLYMLWKHPGILHNYVTHPPVLEKLQNGANLMLPGIIAKRENGALTETSYGRLQKGQTVGVQISSNVAPVGIGFTSISSEDMFMSAGVGRGVQMLHVYKDQLWASGSKQKLPDLGPVDLPKDVLLNQEAEEANNPKVDVNTSDGGAAPNISVNTTNADTSPPTNEESTNHNDNSVETGKLNIAVNMEKLTLHDENDEDADDETMEDLLYTSFLKAVKTTAKNIELPILTSNFYRIHMVSACPDGKTLDVKKSKYKKISKFLQELVVLQLIKVEELNKGIESIVEINWGHPEIKEFVIGYEPPTEKVEVKQTDSDDYSPPEIRELFAVTAAVLPLFKDCGINKGDMLSSVETRKIITTYVKKNELQDKGNKKLVLLDPHLSHICLKKGEDASHLMWDALMNSIMNKMSPAYSVTVPGEKTIYKKGCLPTITVSMQNRAGNKKMTLVVGLSAYYLDPAAVARLMQTRVASSASVTTTASNEVGMQVQGDQRVAIAKLLMEDYNIPKKFIKGLEGLQDGKKKTRR